MTAHVDYVVVGGGVMGSATARSLARGGHDVRLYEAFEQGHKRGSSHGTSRIFRVAYTRPAYAAQAVAALDRWYELEAETETKILDLCGGIDIGDESALADVAAALETIGRGYEIFDARSAHERWPLYSFDGRVLFQEDAGIIKADAALASLQLSAANAGADLAFGMPVQAIKRRGDGAEVIVGDAAVRCRRVVVCPGAWATPMLKGLVPLPPIVVTQEQVFHFRVERPGHWPVFVSHGDTGRYGLDAGAEGFKVAEGYMGQVVTGDTRDFQVDSAARDRVRGYAERTLPGLSGEIVSELTCLYCTTPTRDFVLGRVGAIVVGAGFSGHGFKFGPLIGDYLAMLATDDDARAPFGMGLQAVAP